MNMDLRKELKKELGARKVCLSKKGVLLVLNDYNFNVIEKIYKVIQRKVDTIRIRDVKGSYLMALRYKESEFIGMKNEDLKHYVDYDNVCAYNNIDD